MKKFNKYRLPITKYRALLCIALLLIFLTGCEKKETVIELGVFAGSNWNVPNGNTYQIVDNAIARFEKEHPGVKVVYKSGIMKEDYSEWLAERLLEEKAPDVFLVLSDDFNTLSSIGAMKNLDKLISKDADFHSEGYYQVSYDYGRYGNHQYALPYESVPTMMFINKTMLEKEGIELPENNWNWEDFYDICKAVTKDTDGDGTIDQFGEYGYTWKNAAITNGVNIFNKDGTECVLNDPKMTETVEFLKKLEQLNQGYKVSSMNFDLGKVAFRPMLFSEYITYTPYPWRIKKYSDFEWECISLPAGPHGDNVSELNTLLVGMNERTNDEELSWQLLKMLTYDTRTQMDIFHYSQGVSILKKVTESEEAIKELNRDTPGDSELNMAFLSEAMKNSVVTPKFRKYEEALSIIDLGINDAIESTDNLNVSLIRLQKEVNRYLEN